MNIEKFLVLGAGTLGLRVGLQAAISDYQVTIYDLTDDALTKAKDFQQKILKGLIHKDIIKASDIDSINNRIRWTTDLKEACADADFINESVTEDISVKKSLWQEVGTLCPEKTIFTTNTSYLLPSMLAEDTGRPEKFCAFHFHDVFWANVVDIMPHPDTDPAITDLLFDVGKRLNQTPVLVKKESSGYIF
ncbi:MAG: 3-hydroxyacyl-CoA dehydrogenase NAD-binding domain-containing protein, partial [Bacteroidota bacterium]